MAKYNELDNNQKKLVDTQILIERHHAGACPVMDQAFQHDRNRYAMSVAHLQAGRRGILKEAGRLNIDPDRLLKNAPASVSKAERVLEERKNYTVDLMERG